MRILRNGPFSPLSTHRRGTMSRKIPLVAALVAAALVIPTTAAQAADSGLTPTVSPFTYGDILRVRATTTGRIRSCSRTPPDRMSRSVLALTPSPHPTTDGAGSAWGDRHTRAASRRVSSSHLETPAPSCPTSYGRVCSAIRPPRSRFTATKEPPTSQSAPTSKRPSPTTCPKATSGSRKSSARRQRPTRSTSRTTGTSTSTQCRSPSLTGSR